MEFKDKVVIVTGGAGGIGKTIAEEFTKEGASVCIIDMAENDYFIGDISDKETLEKFVDKVVKDYGHVDYLINNAMKTRGGIDKCSYEDFLTALEIGVAAPYYLTQLLLPYFNPGAAIVNISSSRDSMSQPYTESYSAAKGGISALTHSMAISLAGRVRVNSISPGWIDVNFAEYEGPDTYQQPVGRVGNPLDISNMVLYLCSEKAGFITGENILIDGGMSKQMIYHGGFGWSLEKK